jgi:hypothetical protein
MIPFPGILLDSTRFHTIPTELRLVSYRIESPGFLSADDKKDNLARLIMSFDMIRK